MFIKQNKSINYAGEKWNLQARFKDLGVGTQNLLSIKNNGSRIINIFLNDSRIEAEVLFDTRETPISLIGIPKDLSDVSVLICNTQNRTALYINGELHDEDWPIGKILLKNNVCDFILGDWSIHDDFAFNENYPVSYGELKNIQNWRLMGIIQESATVCLFRTTAFFICFICSTGEGIEASGDWVRINKK